jgi:hypothetical protein
MVLGETMCHVDAIMLSTLAARSGHPAAAITADASSGRWAERPPEFGRRLRRSGPRQLAGF